MLFFNVCALVLRPACGDARRSIARHILCNIFSACGITGFHVEFSPPLSAARAAGRSSRTGVGGFGGSAPGAGSGTSVSSFVGWELRVKRSN